MLRIKQVILIRKDLKMRRGKEIAQGSHASAEFLIKRLRGVSAKSMVALQLTEVEEQWINAGMAKVCLKVESEEQLLSLHKQALAKGLASSLIRDSGKTEFGGQPTFTSCAIGPDKVEAIDAITSDLKLY